MCCRVRRLGLQGLADCRAEFGADEKGPGKIGTTEVRAVTKAVATLYEKDHSHGFGSGSARCLPGPAHRLP